MSGLKQQRVIILHFCRLKFPHASDWTRIKRLSGPSFLLELLWKNPFSYPFQLLEDTYISWFMYPLFLLKKIAIYHLSVPFSVIRFLSDHSWESFSIFNLFVFICIYLFIYFEIRFLQFCLVFFSFLFLNWGIAVLQCCVSFYHTAKRSRVSCAI